MFSIKMLSTLLKVETILYFSFLFTDFSEKLEDIQQKIAKQILLQKLSNKTLNENKLQLERQSYTSQVL
jgi:hypothetical protein